MEPRDVGLGGEEQQRVAAPAVQLQREGALGVDVLAKDAVIKFGLATSQETYDTSIRFVESLGKTIANAEDFPAFIVNRILLPMINEAVYALYEGVAPAESIDGIMKLGMNHPMGPLTLADFIGLDTCLYIAEVLHRELGDDKYRPAPLLRAYVAAGWNGRKAGRGFYRY